MLLQQASKQVDGYLSEKLSELSLILQQYDAISAAEGLDPSQRLTRLAAVLPDTDFFSHTSLYLDGFSCFSEQEPGGCGTAVPVCIGPDADASNGL